MRTEGSARERLAICVTAVCDVRLWRTNGELPRGLTTEVRPATDLHLRDSERMTSHPEVGLFGVNLTGNALPGEVMRGGPDVSFGEVWNILASLAVRRRWLTKADPREPLEPVCLPDKQQSP